MNRILLTSSLAVSAAIIAAHEKGISNSEIFHVSNRLDQLERGTRLLVARPAETIQKMAKRGMKKSEWESILDSDLTRGQIAYCVTKHQKEQKANRQSQSKNNQKKIKLSVKVPDIQTAVNQLAAKVSRQKVIKFSAPLKIITANVQSFC